MSHWLLLPRRNLLNVLGYYWMRAQMRTRRYLVVFVLLASNIDLLIQYAVNVFLLKLTRMHSSRMRTVRSLTVSRSICWGGVGGGHVWHACPPAMYVSPRHTCSPCHTHTPTTHITPLPHMPPPATHALVDRQTRVKT